MFSVHLPVTPLKRVLREELGHGSQTRMARDLGIPKGEMSKITNGYRPGPQRRATIAGWLSGELGRKVKEEELWPV